MKTLILATALSAASLLGAPVDDAPGPADSCSCLSEAADVTVCGDALRTCISEANIEWRRTHDDEELGDSHSGCFADYLLCTIFEIL